MKPRRPVVRRYALELSAPGPWSEALRGALGEELGMDAVGRLAAGLLMACRQASTYATYKSAMDTYCMFLEESEGIGELREATTSTVVRYIAWLGLRGTVAAGSMQPYLSAINVVHRDIGLEEIALGAAVRDAVRGLEGAQRSLKVVVPRVALPAETIVRVLDKARLVCASFTDGQLPLLRACLATVVAFLFFCRASSNYYLHHLPTSPEPR